MWDYGDQSCREIRGCRAEICSPGGMFCQETGVCRGHCSECIPMDCEKWEEKEISCPSCLDLRHKDGPKSAFIDCFLLEHVYERKYLCPQCDAKYENIEEVAIAAIEVLKEVMEDKGISMAS